jgi:hypothetical protein
MGLQNSQQQMMNQLVALQFQVNDIGRDIKGVPGTIAMFDAGDDPLVESSIYMNRGKIGLFTNDPQWPVQVDASLKTKDIYIEKSIRDTSGNILIGYGSPLQIGSTTVDREMTLNTGNLGPAISIDPLNNIIMDGSTTFNQDVRFDGNIFNSLGQPIVSADGTYLKEASLNMAAFNWNTGLLEPSIAGGGGGVSQSYVDGSLSLRDIQIGLRLKEASLGSTFIWTGGIADVCTGGGVTPAYVDTKLLPYATNASVGIALGGYVSNYGLNIALQPYATNASINLAGFVKSVDLTDYLSKTSGGTVSGPLTLTGGITATGVSAVQLGTTNLSSSHGIQASTTPLSCPAIRTTMLAYTITTKGSKLFIMFSCPIRWSTSAWIIVNFYIYINGVEVRHLNVQYYNGVNNISFQHMELVTPGTPYVVEIKWVGESTNVKQDSSERILTVMDLY